MPIPAGPINSEDNRQRRAFPSVVLTGGSYAQNVGLELTATADFSQLQVAGNTVPVAKLLALAATTTLTAAQASGGVVTVALATSCTVVLPAASTVTAGLPLTIVSALAPSSGAGYLVDLTGTDQMKGNGFTPANGKGALNTQATAKVGDSLTVFSDGTSVWYILSVGGTWAREA